MADQEVERQAVHTVPRPCQQDADRAVQDALAVTIAVASGAAEVEFEACHNSSTEAREPRQCK